MYGIVWYGMVWKMMSKGTTRRHKGNRTQDDRNKFAFIFYRCRKNRPACVRYESGGGDGRGTVQQPGRSGRSGGRVEAVRSPWPVTQQVMGSLVVYFNSWAVSRILPFEIVPTGWLPLHFSRSFSFTSKTRNERTLRDNLPHKFQLYPHHVLFLSFLYCSGCILGGRD